ncbi:UNVERIFIED_CONTAM: hypothetical protein GTU68_041232 [Idotea baltica]|nr:hypothetical protein [Idotea baltica]
MFYALNENFTNLTDFEDLQSSLFDFPLNDVYKVISEKSQGSYLGLTAQVVFITLYVAMIVLGIIGNILVAFVIGNKAELRTARNLYIINLTISDVSMCLVCMPFTLVGLLTKNWTLGNVICKLIPALQCTNILVSTATIVAIAADRYRTIVRGNRRFGSQTNVPWSVILIWVISLGFTCPLFIYYYVERVTLRGIFIYDTCRDNWQPPNIKAFWTICLLLMQYVIPILVLGFVHVKIRNFLRENQATMRDPRRMQKEIERNRRTTTLLTSVALTFAVSWLPWHVVNFLADFHYSGFKRPEYFYAVFGGCHVIAMSTSITNPILYGWLNTNLKKELSGLFSRTYKRVTKIFLRFNIFDN